MRQLRFGRSVDRKAISERAFATNGSEDLGMQGVMNDAYGYFSIDLCCDRDRESGVAVEVVRRSVDWVNNPANACCPWAVCALFAENRIVWSLVGEPIKDERITLIWLAIGLSKATGLPLPANSLSQRASTKLKLMVSW